MAELQGVERQVFPANAQLRKRVYASNTIALSPNEQAAILQQESKQARVNRILQVRNAEKSRAKEALSKAKLQTEQMRSDLVAQAASKLAEDGNDAVHDMWSRIEQARESVGQSHVLASGSRSHLLFEGRSQHENFARALAAKQVRYEQALSEVQIRKQHSKAAQAARKNDRMVATRAAANERSVNAARSHMTKKHQQEKTKSIELQMAKQLQTTVVKDAAPVVSFEASRCHARGSTLIRPAKGGTDLPRAKVVRHINASAANANQTADDDKEITSNADAEAVMLVANDYAKRWKSAGVVPSNTALGTATENTGIIQSKPAEISFAEPETSSRSSLMQRVSTSQNGKNFSMPGGEFVSSEGSLRAPARVITARLVMQRAKAEDSRKQQQHERSMAEQSRVGKASRLLQEQKLAETAAEVSRRLAKDAAVLRRAESRQPCAVSREQSIDEATKKSAFERMMLSGSEEMAAKHDLELVNQNEHNASTIAGEQSRQHMMDMVISGEIASALPSSWSLAGYSIQSQVRNESDDFGEVEPVAELPTRSFDAPGNAESSEDEQKQTQTVTFAPMTIIREESESNEEPVLTNVTPDQEDPTSVRLGSDADTNRPRIADDSDLSSKPVVSHSQRGGPGYWQTLAGHQPIFAVSPDSEDRPAAIIAHVPRVQADKTASDVLQTQHFPEAHIHDEQRALHGQEEVSENLSDTENSNHTEKLSHADYSSHSHHQAGQGEEHREPDTNNEEIEDQSLLQVTSSSFMENIESDALAGDGVHPGPLSSGRHVPLYDPKNESTTSEVAQGNVGLEEPNQHTRHSPDASDLLAAAENLKATSFPSDHDQPKTHIDLHPEAQKNYVVAVTDQQVEKPLEMPKHLFAEDVHFPQRPLLDPSMDHEGSVGLPEQESPMQVAHKLLSERTSARGSIDGPSTATPTTGSSSENSKSLLDASALLDMSSLSDQDVHAGPDMLDPLARVSLSNELDTSVTSNAEEYDSVYDEMQHLSTTTASSAVSQDGQEQDQGSGMLMSTQNSAALNFESGASGPFERSYRAVQTGQPGQAFSDRSYKMYLQENELDSPSSSSADSDYEFGDDVMLASDSVAGQSQRQPAFVPSSLFHAGHSGHLDVSSSTAATSFSSDSLSELSYEHTPARPPRGRRPASAPSKSANAGGKSTNHPVKERKPRALGPSNMEKRMQQIAKDTNRRFKQLPEMVEKNRARAREQQRRIAQQRAVEMAGQIRQQLAAQKVRGVRPKSSAASSEQNSGRAHSSWRP